MTGAVGGVGLASRHSLEQFLHLRKHPLVPLVFLMPTKSAATSSMHLLPPATCTPSTRSSSSPREVVVVAAREVVVVGPPDVVARAHVRDGVLLLGLDLGLEVTKICRGLSSYTLVSSSIMDCISFLKLHHLFISETTKISLFSTGKGNQIKYFNHSSEHYQDSLLLLLTMV
jgi:hypothetical protein